MTYEVVAIFCVGLFGVGMLTLFLKGFSFREALEANAVTLGVAGFSASQILFQGWTAAGASAAFLVGVMVAFGRTVRHLAPASGAKSLPSNPAGGANAAEVSLFESEVADVRESRREQGRRLLRVAVFPGVVLAALGFATGVVGATLAGLGLVGLSLPWTVHIGVGRSDDVGEVSDGHERLLADGVQRATNRETI